MISKKASSEGTGPDVERKISRLFPMFGICLTQNKKTIHNMKESILRRRGALEDKKD